MVVDKKSDDNDLLLKCLHVECNFSFSNPQTQTRQ